MCSTVKHCHRVITQLQLINIIIIIIIIIVYIWDSYVYQKGVLCFLTDECYIRSVKRYCFVRQYAAVPELLEIVILQYTNWCVLIVRAFFFHQFSCFCQFLMDNFG